MAEFLRRDELSKSFPILWQGIFLVVVVGLSFLWYFVLAYVLIKIYRSIGRAI